MIVISAIWNFEREKEAATMSRESVFPCVSVISCDNSRVATIKITMNNYEQSFSPVFNVYMLSNGCDNMHIFTDYLSKISAISEDNNVESIVMLVDLYIRMNYPLMDLSVCF